MGAGVVDDSLGAVLDEEFHELERFVDLSPFFCGLFGEAFVDHWHDFVEELAVSYVSKSAVCEGSGGILVECAIGDLLHEG